MRPCTPLALCLLTLSCGGDADWVSALTLDPAVPTAADDVRCVATAEDDRVAIALSWEVDGVALADVAGATLPRDRFVRGQTVTCVATPSISGREGAPRRASAAVANAAPVGRSAEITPSPAHGALALGCAGPAEDPDGDPVTWRAAWTVDGAAVPGDGALPPGSARRGQQVACVATPNDGFEDGAPVAAPAVTLENAPPEVRALAITPGTARVGDTLLAVADAWDADGDAFALTYGWRVDGVVIVSGSDDAFPPGRFIKGQLVEVSVRGRDATEPGAPVVAGVTIANTPPEAPAIQVAPPIGEEQIDPLVCTVVGPSADADGDPVTYRFRWTVDGEPYEDATTTVWPGDTVDPAATRHGQRWACVATAEDGEDPSVAVEATAEVSWWIGPRRFTTCGATGQSGPSDAGCAAAYRGTPLDAEATVIDGVQQWIVPRSGRYRIRAAGAQGADTSVFASQDGGHGAIIEAVLTLDEGDVLQVLVGQAGHNIGGGYTATAADLGAPGGGGASWVVRGDAPLVVAGGGGGAGTVWDATQDGATGPAGNQGNPIGGDPPVACAERSILGGGARGGVNGEGGCSNMASGGGGFLTAGGDASAGLAFLSGGFGGRATGSVGGFGGGGAGRWTNYAGGGGGYSGGGGANNNDGSGGGGGGSYVAPEATDVATSDGRYDGLTTFGGEPVTDLGVRQEGHGAVEIDSVFE